MKTLPIIISFYTKDSPYEWHAEALGQSIKNLGLDYDIQGIASLGSWEANCAYKPLFILEMLQKHRHSVLWVDSDAVFMRTLEWIDAFSADIAVRVNHGLSCEHPSKIVSSTIYIDFNEKSFHLIKKWAEACLEALLKKDRTEEVWDQQVLTFVLKNHLSNFTVGMLPREYLKIFDHPEDEEKCKNPIIIQNQASRFLKKWMNITC